VITVGVGGIPSDKTCVISGCLLRIDVFQLPLLAASETRNALVCSSGSYRHSRPIYLFMQIYAFVRIIVYEWKQLCGH